MNEIQEVIEKYRNIVHSQNREQFDALFANNLQGKNQSIRIF